MLTSALKMKTPAESPFRLPRGSAPLGIKPARRPPSTRQPGCSRGPRTPPPCRPLPGGHGAAHRPRTPPLCRPLPLRPWRPAAGPTHLLLSPAGPGLLPHRLGEASAPGVPWCKSSPVAGPSARAGEAASPQARPAQPLRSCVLQERSLEKCPGRPDFPGSASSGSGETTAHPAGGWGPLWEGCPRAHGPGRAALGLSSWSLSLEPSRSFSTTLEPPPEVSTKWEKRNSFCRKK